ncbi:hypothetical protein QBC41DRAFT_23684 [Cercophora samala]|uniref:Secreted protein n=1 Tax=Cercophora samala TaxID=330535 RepID=A0AA39Z5B1_9PEZI|nr:hypothetical protein QBC41DRAFT_23684 [Cercophora samala]
MNSHIGPLSFLRLFCLLHFWLVTSCGEKLRSQPDHQGNAGRIYKRYIFLDEPHRAIPTFFYFLSSRLDGWAWSPAAIDINNHTAKHRYLPYTIIIT